MRSMVSGVRAKGEPAKESAKDSAKDDAAAK
jgi:preprotein translocase subunit YajC